MIDEVNIEYLRAPFPYFGGKSMIADLIWRRLGCVKRYIEPFFGSGAVLLKRPDWRENPDEIICDKDGHIANVWRSIKFAPDVVAEWAKKRGDNENYRIIIAGYGGEHDELLNCGWTVEAWKANGGYANQGNRQGKENAKRERLWLSPHCFKERDLFD